MDPAQILATAKKADTDTSGSQGTKGQQEPVQWSDGFHSPISLASESIGTRNDEQTRQMKDKIALIARVFSKNYGMEVIPSGGGWACTIGQDAVKALHEFLMRERDTLDDLPDEMFDATTILYDEKELRSLPEENIMGVMRHEVGHANFSDFRVFFKGQRHAVDQGFLPTTWMEIHNALEDPWVNIKESDGSAVVQRNMACLYEKWTADVVANIGSQTLLRQLGLNIIHYWLYQKNIPTLKNQQVLKVFEKIEPFVDQYFCGESASANYELLRDKIWEHVAPLEEQSTSQELKKMLSESMSGAEGPGARSRSAAGRAMGRAMKGIRKALGRQTEEEKLQEKIEKALKDTDKKDFKEQLKQELERQKKERQSSDKQIGEQGHPTGSMAQDIDIDDMPEDLQQALEDLAKELPEDLKEELRRQARKRLDDKQAENLKRNLPKTMEITKDPESGENQCRMKPGASDRDLKKGRKKLEQEERKLQKENERRTGTKDKAKVKPESKADDSGRIDRKAQEEQMKRMQAAGFGEEEADLYREFSALESSISTQIRKLARLLEKEFPRDVTYTHEGEYYTGSKINKSSVAKRAPLKDYRIFSRKQAEYTLQPLITVDVWIDRSGSMMGPKMDSARKTSIALGRLLRMYDIPFSLGVFAGDGERIKLSGQDYDSRQNRIKPLLMNKTDGSGASTNISAPIKAAADEIERNKKIYPNHMHLVCLITDGDANSGATGNELKKMIEGLQKNATVVNFVLGASDHEVELSQFYFGEQNVIAPDDFEQLPQETVKIIAGMMRKFKRRHQMEN